LVREVAISGNKIKIDIEDLPEGLYFIKTNCVYSDLKFIKQ
jgi:hypothetical protein